MFKALYMMASATETLSQQSYQRVRAIFLRHGFKPKEDDMLTGLNNYCRSVKLATTQFFEYIEPRINGATFQTVYDKDRHDETIDTAIGAYDGFDSDSMELIRLVLLYIDRTSKSDENYAKLFKTLRTMESGGIFEDKDIARFKQK